MMPQDEKYETGWSLTQCDEAAHVFHAVIQRGIDRSLAHDFHEWCEEEGLPKAERNKVWECLAPYVEQAAIAATVTWLRRKGMGELADDIEQALGDEDLGGAA
jgi:hypothetical protein